MEPLTVAQLIEELKKLPQDLPVGMRVDDHVDEVVTAYVGRLWAEPHVVLE